MQPTDRAPDAAFYAQPSLLVRLAIKAISPAEPEVVLPHHELLGDLGYHSLALTELVFALQDLFSAHNIDPGELVAIRSVQDLTDLIERSLADGSAQPPSAGTVREFCSEYDLEEPVSMTRSVVKDGSQHAGTR